MKRFSKDGEAFSKLHESVRNESLKKNKCWNHPAVLLFGAELTQLLLEIRDLDLDVACTVKPCFIQLALLIGD